MQGGSESQLEKMKRDLIERERERGREKERESENEKLKQVVEEHFSTLDDQ